MKIGRQWHQITKFTGIAGGGGGGWHKRAISLVNRRVRKKTIRRVGNWCMPLYKLTLIMEFNMQKKLCFEEKKCLPREGGPPSHTLPLLTAVAKVHSSMPLPTPRCLESNKLGKGGEVGSWSMPLHNILPQKITFNLIKNAHFDTRNFKNLPTVGGGHPPPPPPHTHTHTLLPLGRFAPSLWPLVDKAWLHYCHRHSLGNKGPCSHPYPLIEVKEIEKEEYGIGKWHITYR